MDISGNLRINCTPDALVDTLSDQRALERMLPEGAQLSMSGPGQFGFVIGRAFGPIRLTLPGTMTVSAKGAGPDQVLSIRASHVVGGKVDLDMDLKIEKTTQGSRLSYSGKVKATGLAGRVLKENGNRIEASVKAGMTRLKLVAESRARHSA